jgi:chromosome segregation ATPase
MKEKIKNLDTKSYIIIILFIMCFFFIFKWSFDSNNHKKERTELERNNRKLKNDRKFLDREFDKMSNKIKEDSIIIYNSRIEIQEINNEIKLKDDIISVIENDIEIYKKEIKERKKEIQYLRQNPKNRTGEELLKSIKEKTK